MDNSRSLRRKLAEWLRRYLPCHIAGTVAELGGAGLLFALTDSLAAAAVAATVGASVGFYAVAYGSAARLSYTTQTHRRRTVRLAAANGLALRSVAIEFGPAEVVDSLAVRPLAYYLGPVLADTAMLGWIGAMLFSDLVFYSCAAFSYERFNRLLARKEEHREKVDDEPVTTARAA